MKVKMILPALTEATSPYWRPIKYSLFPPLGLASLAAYLDEDDEVSIQDEHVEKLDLDDTPDLVAVEVYITSAHRAYRIADHYRARGVHVALGGLHVTALPEEAGRHADTIFIGPGEDTWPRFLADFRDRRPGSVYRSDRRSLLDAPLPRRDLIKRQAYLVPNSVVVSRGCPYHCDFCYKDSFFSGGKSFYTRAIDQSLREIDGLPGRHLFFLDDNLFADRAFADHLFSGMSGMGRVWQAAATVQSIAFPGLLEKAAHSGLRSLFVGFETLSTANLNDQHKFHNQLRDYETAVQRMHDLGVMVNASFVFGMDHDDATVFERTVEWATRLGIETATFHILTPYPGTTLYRRMTEVGRMTSFDWDLYDTRHVVFKPALMSPEALQAGYWRAYRDFYSWEAVFQGAWSKDSWSGRLRHLAYAGGWKKFEPFWDLVIRSGAVGRFRPLLESVLQGTHRNEPEGESSPKLLSADGCSVLPDTDGGSRVFDH